MSTWNIMRLRGGTTPRKKTAMFGNAKAAEDMLVTYWCFAVWNDEHKIIIDCGVNEEDEHPWYNPPANTVPPEDKLPAQLDYLGWKPEDVDTVIFTHLHYDHFDEEARKRLPKNLPILSQSNEDARALRNYLYQLQEQLGYVLTNLDSENMSENFLSSKGETE